MLYRYKSGQNNLSALAEEHGMKPPTTADSIPMQQIGVSYIEFKRSAWNDYSKTD
jgi:hypothetical protein